MRGDVAVVGGGMLGMTLALRFQQLGRRVTIIEAAPTVGGLVGSQSIGGYTWDRFYHVILLSDRHLHGLLDELGLSDLLRWGVTRTGFYVDARLHSLSSVIDFVRFPPLSPADKLRLAATVLHASRIRDWRPLESMLATQWLRRLSGERVFTRIWEPLLRSKLGDNYRIASAAFIWAIIARMYAARRSGLKREMFGYVEGGYSTVLAAFQAALERRNVEFVLGRAVAEVASDGDGVAARFDDGELRSFGKVVLTVPCGTIRRIAPELSSDESTRLAGVVYQGIICASVLLARPLAGFYITNITDPAVPFTAVIEMTALVNPATMGGRTLVYLPWYVTADDPAWRMSDADIRRRFLNGLARMYPGLDERDVLAFDVARVREMLAVTTLDYSDRWRPRMATSVPNLYVVNSAQIANGTLNVNETVGLANAAAAELEALFTSGESGKRLFRPAWEGLHDRRQAARESLPGSR